MIKIDDNFFLTADTYNVILNETKINKETGKEYSVILGYYTDVTSALQGLLRKKMKRTIASGEGMTLEQAIEKFEKIEKEITDVSKNF